MIDIFLEQKIVAVCMFGCFALSIFLKIFLGTLYRHMIKEADNMAITNNRLLKQCKTKFSNCYELNNGIHNIPIFVDKFINKLSLGHFSFDLLYHLSGQLMLLSVAAAGAGICQGIIAGHTMGEILPFYIVSLLGLYLYFSVSTVVDIKGKRRVLKVNLVDYLENHLSSRINTTKRDMEMLYGDGTSPERSAAEEGQSGDRKGSGKSGRKTVELMPLGGRGTTGKSGRAAEAAVKGVSQEAREIALSKAREEEQDMIQQAMEAAQRMPQGGLPPATRAPKQEALQQESGVQTSAGDAAVTEEELEMLLKEFLTG